MASTCPENENSTDCLLRALLQFTENEANAQDSKFDWNPITFAFTVPIGLLATIFALITICQAVLASGPGRRKSSNRTIGDEWASLTKSRWNWHDFNRVSIAKTPLMRSRKIQTALIKFLEKENQNTDKSLDALEKMYQKSQFSKATPATATIKRHTEPPAATWLRLLRHVGLHDKDFGKDEFEITAADYLPDDIPAVPAYADLGFIVAVTAAAGAYSFKIDPPSPYPVITGDGFQFDFRQHPTLGNIGAFLKYGQGDENMECPTTRQVILALRHSRGDIDIGPSFLSKRATVPETGQKEEFNIHFPFQPGVKIRTWATSVKCKQHSGLCKDAEERSNGQITDEYHLLWLFLARLPETTPATFPSKKSNCLNVLQMLALNSPFWSSPNESQWNDKRWLESFYDQDQRHISLRSTPENPTDENLKELSEIFLHNKGLDETDGWTKNDHTWSGDYDVEAWRKNRAILYGHVCEKGAKFLYKIEDFIAWFDAMTSRQKRYFRLLVLLQLLEVDRRLKRANKNGAVSCQIFSLYYTTLALLDSKRAIEDNSFGVSKRYNTQKTNWDSLNVDDGPQSNLIVRHFKTLGTLGAFLDTPTLPDPNTRRHKYDEKKLLCIFKSQLDGFGQLELFLKWEYKVLCNIKTILDSCHNTILKNNWERFPEQSVSQGNACNQSGTEREHREEEDNLVSREEMSDGRTLLDIIRKEYEFMWAARHNKPEKKPENEPENEREVEQEEQWELEK
ncbi:hypothetical protein BGZ57DRAFT_979993 [Hyaloscypha finlandica]|nr:hypothetical protein BGZ57DRAFT_979993 [Hyaloscypha finlandica]